MIHPHCPRAWRGYFFAVAWGVATCANAAPWVPIDDATVIEQLPPERIGNILRAFEASGRGSDRRDPMVAVMLARRFVERARSQADPRQLGYAQGVLMPWWNEPDAPVDVLLMRATLRQARHQFDLALQDLDRVIARRPEDGQAWLTRAMVLRTQGRYDEAGKACHRLTDVAPGFAATLCVTALRGLSGDLEGALDSMRALQGASAAQPASIRIWFDLEHAEMLERMGRRDVARVVYVEALERASADPSLIAAYADFLLDDGLFREAETLTEPWLRIDALRLRHAIALRAQQKTNAADVTALAESFAAARRRGEELHLREEARFALEVQADLARALDLAKGNWAVQREPADVRLLLACANATNTPHAARPALAWLAESKMQDSRLSPFTGATR